jgi:hypothetical protein
MPAARAAPGSPSIGAVIDGGAVIVASRSAFGRGLADQLADFRDFWPHPGKGTGDTLDDAAIAGAGKAMAK